MQDGWTDTGVQYVRLYAIYDRQRAMIAKGIPTNRTEVVAP